MLFDRFFQPSRDSVDATNAALRKQLTDFVLDRVRDQAGRIRVEDAICASATIVGERCIDAAGNFSLRDHDFIPGSRVFSEKANYLICGDLVGGSWEQISADSVAGILHRRLETGQYSRAEFPILSQVFEHYAKSAGRATEWGKVPLSVGSDHWPWIVPLRFGYETRNRVDEIFSRIPKDPLRCLKIATESLADILTMVVDAIDHRVALLVALETINGMAKTAPMTSKAMEKARSS